MISHRSKDGKTVFQYEVKAPNVIHLLMGSVRREIRLLQLSCELFADDQPMAVMFKLNTDHKDIYIPSYPLVIYVKREDGLTTRGIWGIMDHVVREIVEIIQIKKEDVAQSTLSYREHYDNYAMRPSKEVIRVPGKVGTFLKTRIQLGFVPTALRLDNYLSLIHI